MEQLYWLKMLGMKFFSSQIFLWFITAPEVRYFVLGLLILFVFTYMALLYNNLVRLTRNIDRAFANIEVLLKQRHDELFKLVDVCKEYMKYEKDTLVNVIEARSRAIDAYNSHDNAAIHEAEAAVRANTKQLIMQAEQYPQLHSSASFQELQQRLTNLEIAIADRREYYNQSVTNYNNRVQSVPDNVIAGIAGYKHMPLLTVFEKDTADVKIF